MAIQSRQFGGVTLSGVDADAFRRQFLGPVAVECTSCSWRGQRAQSTYKLCPRCDGMVLWTPFRASQVQS